MSRRCRSPRCSPAPRETFPRFSSVGRADSRTTQSDDGRRHSSSLGARGERREARCEKRRGRSRRAGRYPGDDSGGGDGAWLSFARRSRAPRTAALPLVPRRATRGGKAEATVSRARQTRRETARKKTARVPPRQDLGVSGVPGGEGDTNEVRGGGGRTTTTRPLDGRTGQQQQPATLARPPEKRLPTPLRDVEHKQASKQASERASRATSSLP